MSLLARARKLIEEREAWWGVENRLEALQDEAGRSGLPSSPIEQLETVDWPSALEAVQQGFLRMERSPDSDSLTAAAALALFLADASEKQEKGEKSEVRYGLNVEEARALLARIYLGQPARLSEAGQIESVDG